MKRFLFITLLFFTNAAIARSGGIVGNPADQVEKPFAWFLGDQPVIACIEKSPDFPGTPERIEQVLLGSIDIWKRYTESKQLKEAWTKGVPYLNFNYTFNKSCRGNEDVTFYFGVENPRIAKARSQFRDPSAFSQLESYNRNTGRGRGFVWFENPEKRRIMMWHGGSQVHVLFMHEFGHILGCDHVAGTIMREDLAKFLVEATPETMTFFEASEFGERIDHRRELYFSPSRGVGAMHAIVDHPTEAQKTIFKRVMKRDLAGPLFMAFMQGTGDEQNLADLYFSDDPDQRRWTKQWKVNAYRVKFDPGASVDFSTTDSLVFRHFWKNQEGSFRVPGFLTQGSLVLNKATGEKINIVYARNRGEDEYVRLMFNDGSGTKEFFRAFLPEQHAGW